ncbi:MAG TPA: biotin--[acetyl-CoA-carboxylase] ligase [Eggerthellaceae bacterium]|nr:biotin--[acetyl-CoA-carboxylase] ligase [Eggerthellaceae bacterium]
MEPFSVANFAEVTSTNDQVKKALKAHANEGYVCRAAKQTGGYGRQGRYWTSPEGGLYQSVLLRPKCELAKLPTLGFVMALAIRAALVRLAARSENAVLVKWPNDLMVGDKKIAGISMEATAGGVCIGMGVNVFRPANADSLLSDSKYRPAFFADMAVGHTDMGSIAFGSGYSFSNQAEAIAAVGDAILSSFAQCYPVWLENGFDPFVKEYESCSYLQGKRVRMQLLNGDVIVEGTVVGIDRATACLLVDDGTQVRPVNSGEAHIL